jgi:hypothetical protein
MRRRLRKFLPIVLFALVVQVLAPIAACWAAVIAASDPLAAAEICRDGRASTGQAGDPAGPASHHVHDAGCCLSCASHGGTSVDTPEPAAIVTPYRQAERVVWRSRAPELFHYRIGSQARARAPPSFS